MPKMLPVSTALILISSVSIAIARRMLGQGKARQYRNWLLSTGILGVGFLVSQLISWKELVAQGIYLASNPHSSFFYLLTALHGLHLLGGILALGYVSVRDWRRSRITKAIAASLVSIYWHFMDGLWLFLLALLYLGR